ncbi:MAG: hypothetical protein RLN83_00565 [Balneola sp.]
MKKKLLKITFTSLWIIIAIWITVPKGDGKQIGDYWVEGGDLVVKTSNPVWFDNIGTFLILMVPVAVVWLWSLFSKESVEKPVKRRSRMF